MAGRWRWVALAIAVVVTVPIAVSWLALESGAVAVLGTRGATGALRQTHVWFVASEGELWVEAGTPENGWYLDVLHEPRLSFSATGRTGTYLARPSDSPEVHAALRRRLSAKYGWRDRWVGLFVDSSRSLAVALEPAP